eukprot:jgi/Tetstr1/441050/TSEL_029318.t1
MNKHFDPTKLAGASRLFADKATIGYDSRVISRELSVQIPDHGFTVIVGANACGKSTLLRALSRLIQPSQGHVMLDGKAISHYPAKEVACRLGLLPQTSIAPEGITVADLVARGRYPHQKFIRQWSVEDEAAVIGAMEATKITPLSHRLVDELSGGQRQRVWVAMVLAQQTPMLLLDEPTTYLDIAHQIELLELLSTLNKRDGHTVVAVLHDLNHACRYASHIIAMRDGQILAEGAPGEIITANLVEESQTWGGDENGYLPWVKEAIEELGEDLPVALDTANGLPFEQILELEPDLILAPYGGISQDDYDRLSAIAPTVAFKEAPWTGSWQYVVETVGAAMGRSEEASGLVDSTQDRIAEYAAENPQFAGRTFAFGGGSNAGSVGLYVPSDPRVHLMEDLGLVPAEALNDLPTDNYVQQVSFEQLDSVDAEVFIAWYSSQDDLDAILANPLFARWKPIANDNFVPLIDRAFVMAVSAPSPLSIPWMMDRFVPILAETLEQ